jgi:hypothetical protein
MATKCTIDTLTNKIMVHLLKTGISYVGVSHPTLLRHAASASFFHFVSSFDECVAFAVIAKWTSAQPNCQRNLSVVTAYRRCQRFLL